MCLKFSRCTTVLTVVWGLGKSLILKGKREEKDSENYIKEALKCVPINKYLVMKCRTTKWARRVECTVECINTEWL